MNAIILSIGNELLSGKTVNSNASYIGRKLYEIGIVVSEIQTIADDAAAIRNSLGRGLAQFDLVFMTGGLGPTHDDITKKVVAEYFNAELIFREDVMAMVEERFRSINVKMPEVNRNQALVPQGAIVLENTAGTAPGMRMDKEGASVFIMPGVPAEMKAIMREHVLPFLREKSGSVPLEVRQYRTTSIPESKLYERCKFILEAHPDFQIAFLPRFTGVDIRLSVPAGRNELLEELEEFERKLNEVVGNYIYAVGKENIEEVVQKLMLDGGLTLAVAESCSGGLIQHRVTNVAGSSGYFNGGAVTYSNAAKEKHLGVNSDSLQVHGAVSEVVAKEMAIGVRMAFQSDIGLATTGIAGPGGGTPEKPVGLIYMALAREGRVHARELRLTPSRKLNKELTAQLALDMLRRDILGISR
ncbi:MAG: competence/damage-inducible protein A [Calditrichota bacterium]